MSPVNIDVQLEPSFRKKINHAAVQAAEQATIRNTTLQAEKLCKVQAPGPGNQLPGTTYKASGNLRRSHSTQIGSNEGLVRNNAHYANYVIHGTSKMPARNYPQKVANELSSSNYMTRMMLTELRRRGVIE
jgi:phage gpG-like protein